MHSLNRRSSATVVGTTLICAPIVGATFIGSTFICAAFICAVQLSYSARRCLRHRFNHPRLQQLEAAKPLPVQ